MSLQLYFLRSSEQKIVTDMLYYAHRVDVVKKTLQDFPELHIYDDFYGLTRKDLGLYAMKEHVVCGAIWSRRLNKDHNADGFVDEDTPTLSIAVKPEYRNQGVATAMMKQFLQEQSALSTTLSINVLDEPKSIAFFQKFGFEEIKKSEFCTTKEKSVVMLTKLTQTQTKVEKPKYDYSKWLD